MTDRRPPRKPSRALDQTRLEELALAYVGRFATSRAKLAQYLRRKIAEKGWEASGPPEVEMIVEKLARLNYVDDAAFALAKARSLGQRGYGGRRVDLALRAAGIGEQDGAPAKAAATAEATEAAIRYAQRRRIGPFSTEAADPKARARALSAMIRAGHGFELSKRLIDLPPQPQVETDALNRLLCG